MVEDSPGDAELTAIALKECRIPNHLSVVNHGLDAVRFLKREGEFQDALRPDIIFLDWNLPGMDGAEVLTFIKSGELRGIPVIVLTTSRLSADVQKAYDLRANCFISKPTDLERFFEAIQLCQVFWLPAPMTACA